MSRVQPKWIIDFQIEELESIENAAEWFLDDVQVYVAEKYITVREYWNQQNANA